MTRSISSGQAWIIEGQTSAIWNLDRTGATKRITEPQGLFPQSAVRITEQGNVRIIEYFRAIWTQERPPGSIWNPE